MTRTSIEAARRRNALGDQRFRRALLAVVVVLAVACAGFAVLGVVQGPRMSSFQVDEVAVTERPGQQLRIFTNQSIAQLDPEQVTVEPDVPHTATVSGDVIAITFGRALDYGTEYTVRIDDVTSPYLSVRSTVSASFTTAATEAWVLSRGVPDDVIVRTTLSGDREQMYVGSRIQSFAVLNNALAIATVDEGFLSSLSLTSYDGVNVEQLLLPSGTSLRGLAIDPGGTVLGFQLTSLVGDEVAPDTLYLVDLEAGRTIEPVQGLDGTPLRVIQWQFDANGGIIAMTNEGMLIQVTADGATVPLGRVDGLGALSADGQRVVVGENGVVDVLELSSGTRTPLELDGLGARVPILDSAHLAADGSVVLVAVSAKDSRVQSEVMVAQDGAARSVFATTGGSIADVSISPNGQLAAITLVPDVSAARSDGYGAEAIATSVETVFVELTTGDEVARMSGFHTQW